MNLHGLEKDFVNKILELGFEDKSFTFYNTSRKQVNLDSINGFAKLMRWATTNAPHHIYVFINKGGIFKVKLLGDSTATVEKLAEANENSLILTLELLKK